MKYDCPECTLKALYPVEIYYHLFNVHSYHEGDAYDFAFRFEGEESPQLKQDTIEELRQRLIEIDREIRNIRWVLDNRLKERTAIEREVTRRGLR